MATTKIVKHQFGTPNPVFSAEEDSLLAKVDLAISSAPNSQVLGRNGELPLVDFFSRYLPYTLRVCTGFFLTPAGKLSPQIDLLLLDARYPLLAENRDGSVLAMLHGVVWAIEVKTNLKSRDFSGMWSNARAIMALADEIKTYGLVSEPVSLRTSVFAYRVAQGIEPTTKAFIKAATPENALLDVFVTRLPKDPANLRRGVELEFEASFPRSSRRKQIWRPVRRFTHTPPSDFYYAIVQWSYLVMEHRDWSLGDIGQHT